MVPKFLVQQHIELISLVEQISTLMEDSRPHSTAIVRLLNTLSGKLKVDLAAEDQSLYPSLTAHSKPEIAAIARAYLAETDGLVKSFQTYWQKYNIAPKIENDIAAAFRQDSRSLFQALRTRIHKEDQELYPLLSNRE